MDTTCITVGGPAPYDVVIGHALTDRVVGLAPNAMRILVAADERVEALAQQVVTSLRKDAEVSLYLLPSGEQAKSLDVVAQLWAEMGSARLTRSDAVVGVG